MKKFISWNVNGIRAIQKKGFVEFVKSSNADIIAIQETKANIEQLSDELVNIPNYHSYFASAEKKGYSGVAVYSKETPLKIEKHFIQDVEHNEGRILILTFKDFIFVNIYFPNGKSRAERLQYKLDFYSQFLKFIEDNKNTGLIICGDVNTAHTEIDLSRPKENAKTSGFLPVERDFLDKFIEKGLIDTFRVFNKNGENYTWWDAKTKGRERNVGWRIDYFYINQVLIGKLKSATIKSDIFGSDHCPIEIKIDF